jgi:class 3 adenylate cyclase/pimeloyl-ACP methyl ester carboxylesterase
VSPVDVPETRYTTSGDVRIAYQIFGEGPVDLVWIPGFVTNVEFMWEYEPTAAFARRLGSFARVIAFDKRGTGLSDRVAEGYIPDLETRMDDARAVMDAAEVDRAVVLGFSEGGAMGLLFAATYPERTLALIEYAGHVRYAWAPDFVFGEPLEEHERYLESVRTGWGTREMAARELAAWAAPSVADDPDAIEWFAELMRRGASAEASVALERMNREIDVRSVLPLIRVPTLIVHREDDPVPTPGSYLAERIPAAELVVLPGNDCIAWFGDPGAILDAFETFVKDVRDEEAEFDRVLATVVFTDIVGSTETVSRMGDRAWAELIERHHATVRSLLARYRGVEVDTAGDGFFATFDGPARGVRCAQQIVRAVRQLGLDVRAGVHTGEVRSVAGKVGGLGVVIGARVGSAAHAGEVLVSSTVKDLVAGSGLLFEDRGTHELKGVPEEWHLFAATSG